MTGRRIMLENIENDRARRNSFRNKSAGLVKKKRELSIYCDVDCFIISYDGEGGEPLVWPSAEKVQQLMQRYQSIPVLHRYRNVLNQEHCLRDRINKLQLQVEKRQRENTEKEMANVMDQIFHQGKSLCEFNVTELINLVCFTEKKVREYRGSMVSFNLPCSFPPEQPWFVNLLRETNGVNGGANIYTVLPADEVNSSASNAVIGGNHRLGIPYGNFGGPNGGFDVSLPYDNFGVRLPSETFGGNIIQNDMALRSFDGNLRSSFGGINMANSDGNVVDNGQNLGEGLLPLQPHGGKFSRGTGMPFGSFGGSSLGGPNDIFRTWPNHSSP
ncbi:hypothetical protein L6164_009535 [Bauhinia variegata]|uniref:Uncharacterized protein n=1 Tax=Bauhinia variegata TaxID=167791 RepID=A0ACB9PK83_BAUVA|nr:hypothetical protein L6164_009535 [Bauhinia variegata]